MFLFGCALISCSNLCIYDLCYFIGIMTQVGVDMNAFCLARRSQIVANGGPFPLSLKTLRGSISTIKGVTAITKVARGSFRYKDGSSQEKRLKQYVMYSIERVLGSKMIKVNRVSVNLPLTRDVINFNIHHITCY